MSSPRFNSDIVKKLYEEGATFIFLDVPAGTEFGIDMNVFYIGEKFRGVKMIPPGIHFVYYSAVSKQGQSAPRTGFFHNFLPKEIVVKKWNKYNETISDEIIKEEEIERFRMNLKSLDEFLGPYPYKTLRKWISLTNHITEPILNRLQPESGIINSVTQLTSQPFFSDRNHRMMETEQATTAHHSKTEDCLPNMEPVPEMKIQFVNIPIKRYPEGASPAEITKHNMDSTFLLEQVLLMYDKPEDMLGELQMSFVCFLVGHVFEAFEQWQKLVSLLCTSDIALEKYTDLYLKFIVITYFQLKEIPKDFFVDIVSSNNFLTTTFQIFFSNLDNSKVDELLRKRGLKFKENLTKIFKWDFESEPDDCAPVIIET